MPKREITVQAASAARFRVPNGAWIYVPFSGLARAGSVTAEKPGNDIAYVDINNLGGANIYVVLFDAVTAATPAPNVKDIANNFTNPAPAGHTMNSALRVDVGGSLTLDRFRGIAGVSLFAPAAHHADVEVVLTSYSNDTVAPWS